MFYENLRIRRTFGQIGIEFERMLEGGVSLSFGKHPWRIKEYRDLSRNGKNDSPNQRFTSQTYPYLEESQ